jgi:hypothetical protein
VPVRRLLCLVIALIPASAAAQRFNPSQLAARRDSFEVMVNGQAMGYSSVTLTREGENARVVTELTLPTINVRETRNMVFNATTLMPVSHEYRQTSRNSAATTRVTVANGRATGTAEQPRSGTVITSPVDVVIPPGAVDDELLGVLIPTLDLAEGFRTSFPTFYASGSIQSNALTVEGKETIVVPAGAFEVYRVALELPSKEVVTMYVTTAPPRRTILIRGANAVIEMRLLK